MGSTECVFLMCCSQEGALLPGTADRVQEESNRAECMGENKISLAFRLNGRCSCPSSTTQDRCTPVPSSHVLSEETTLLQKRERRGSHGAVNGRNIANAIVPCLPLPPPSIPPLPGTPPQTPDPGGSDGLEAHSPASSRSSLLSDIPQRAGSLTSLFGAAQDNHSSPSSPKGSSHATIKNGINTVNGIVSCSDIPSKISPDSGAVASSKAATPTEEADVKCQWKACGSVVAPAHLLEHLHVQHVDTQKDQEKFVCEWDGCKVAGMASCSMSWLERHVITHGGLKPFCCILPNCGVRFSSQAALHRHLNSHFSSEKQSGGGRSARSRGEEASGRSMRRRTRLKRGRPQCVKNGDIFDIGIMDQLRRQLLDLTEKTQMDLNDHNGSSHRVTFQGTVMACRTDQNGKQSMLLHWNPQDVLEDIWVPSSHVESLWKHSIPLRQLPASTVSNVHPSLYQRHRFRKHRRK